MADKEFRHLVRIANTDLDGNKTLHQALANIKGVGFSLANAILHQAAVDKHKKTGHLTDAEIKKISQAIASFSQSDAPTWLFNRQKDFETGEDKHLLGVDLHMAKDFDIKRLKKIKAYRGIRHMFGLPTRGQRTKANFRRNKGKVTGVKRKSKKTGRV